MSELKGLEDRLITKGSPKSVNNGGVPTTANTSTRYHSNQQHIF